MIKLFSAGWCTPCKSLKLLMKANSLKAEVVDIDSLKGSEEARALDVRGIPMLYDTETGGKIIGNISLTQLRDFYGSDMA